MADNRKTSHGSADRQGDKGLQHQPPEPWFDPAEGFRVIFEHAPHGVAVVDVTTQRFVQVNRIFCDITGYTPAELAERTVQEITHPGDWQAEAEIVASYLEGRIHECRVEKRYVRKDGTLRWVRVSGVSSRISTARHPVVIFFVEDIHESRAARERLRQSETRFRLLAENATDVIWTRDLGLNLTYISPAIERLTGYTPEESLALSVEERMTPASIALMKAVAEEELALEASGGADPARTRTLEIEERRRDGTTVWIEVTARFLRDEAGRPTGILGVSRDVTERKRSEERLQKAYRETEQIFDAAVPMAVIGRDFTMKRVNGSFARLFGVSADAVIGAPCHVMHSDGPCHTSQCLMRRILGGERRAEAEVRVERGGEVRTCTAAAVPHTNGNGEIRGIIESYVDITERRRAEERARRADQRFRNVVNTIHEAIFFVDRDHRIQLANPAGAAMMGVDLDACAGKRCHDLFYGRRERCDPCPVNEAIRTERVIRSLRHHPSGRILNRTVYPFAGEDGEVVGAVIAAEDITEGRKAEAALRDREERLSLALQGASLGTWDWDIRTDRVVFDERWAEMKGYALSEIEPRLKTLQDLLHPEDRPRTMARLDAHLRGETPLYEAEFRMRHQSGQWIWILDKGRVIERDADGRPLRACGTHLDITERKRAQEERLHLERELRQAQKIEAMGTLAGGIAHDFNNILSAILGFAEMVEMDLPEGSRNRQDLGEVLKATHRARDLVKQILTFSRRGEAERRPLRLGVVVKEAMNLLRSSLPSSIEIRTSVSETAPPVLADPTRIHQIVMNLCTNAAQAMEMDRGVLTVTLEGVRVTERTPTRTGDIMPGHYARLRVSDTGGGIPQGVLEQIFDPYFTTKPKGEGTGLGLAVVYGIVKECGSGISVESAVGRGTTFTLYFPATEEQGTVLKPDRPGPLPRGRERILFVDDERAIVSLGKSYLERLGYEVTADRDPEKALERLRSDPDAFDLLVTDMTMPRMSGDALAGAALSIRPDLPVILCTGYSRSMSEQEARKMGVRAFVLKPLTQRELATMVRQVLDRGAASKSRPDKG